MKKSSSLRIGIFCAICIVGAIASPAQTFNTLVNFNGTNGSGGGGAPVQSTDGNLYGGTGGGVNNSGILYKLTTKGKLTTLYTFCAQAGCTDGNSPSRLLLGTDQNLYGTTLSGGSYGYGTVFTLTEWGTLSPLTSFDNTDGAAPSGSLAQESDGNLYGAAAFGGNLANCLDGTGCGTIFQVTPGGTLTTLYTFCPETGCADGAVVFGPLAEGTDGNFYGATYGGGTSDAGTIFKITPEGSLTTLYTFCVTGYPFCSDGDGALWVVLGRDGNFYGTTQLGGAFDEGTFFTITPEGTLSTIYNFCTKIACEDGAFPRSGPILGSDGNFYGTTYYGGASNKGSIYRITPKGALTTLHSFIGTDGNYPINEMVQATNGAFYGTTTVGGSKGMGTIFSLAAGLNPFVEILPTSGSVGAAVTILGTELTGASFVTFDGIAAPFKVVSSSEIMATVPAGATTGEVTVNTPGGKLKSNVVFRVRR